MLIQATIDVQLTVSINDDKTLPLATFISDPNVESSFLKTLSRASTQPALSHSVVKNAYGNDEQLFKRRDTDTHTAVTTAENHESGLHYVEDSDADHDEYSYFRPVEGFLSFDGQNRYQQNITSVNLTTSLSYGYAADRDDAISERVQSLTIINRRVREYGDKLKQFLPDYIADTEAGAVTPNRTKCYSQDDDCSFHSIQATLGEDTADKSQSLLNLSVNGD